MDTKAKEYLTLTLVDRLIGPQRKQVLPLIKGVYS